MKINTAVPYLWYFVAKLSINQDMLTINQVMLIKQLKWGLIDKQLSTWGVSPMSEGISCIYRYIKAGSTCAAKCNPS